MSTSILDYFNSHDYPAYQQEYIVISTAGTKNKQENYIFMFIHANIKTAWSYSSTSPHPEGTKPCINITKTVFFLIFLPPLISA
jgi:hypothetical protein